MTHDEMIEVIKAHKEGKRLERRSVGGFNNWHDRPASVVDNFNFCDWEYRVKREPFECWAVIYGLPGEVKVDSTYKTKEGAHHSMALLAANTRVAKLREVLDD